MKWKKEKGIKILAGMFLACCLLSGCGEQGAESEASGSSSSSQQETVTESSSEQTNAEQENAEKAAVTYNLNYEGAEEPEVLFVELGEVPTVPNDPVRTGYTFNGWYNEAECSTLYDFEYAVEQDVTIYAGWSQSSVTVEFLDNDTGTVIDTKSIGLGDTVEQPFNPEREGYIFTTWYKDEACRDEFDFSSGINENITLYAGWEEMSGDTVTLTYHWNYEGAPEDICNVAYANANSKTSAFRANRKGYYLEGWYEDPECTTKFDFTKRVQGNAELYAKWYNIYTFEAEYTDVDGITGFGYSGNATGTQIITADNNNGGASNGYYVSWLYNEGITLKFNIHSDREVEDAVLVLRASGEFYDIHINDETYLITVNGEEMKYGSIDIVDVPEVGKSETHPFGDYTISKGVSLKEGDNEICLITNNSMRLAAAGTLNATAPIVDCIKLSTDAELTWEAKESNIQ